VVDEADDGAIPRRRSSDNRSSCQAQSHSAGSSGATRSHDTG
jgi:hypothetical protein